MSDILTDHDQNFFRAAQGYSCVNALWLGLIYNSTLNNYVWTDGTSLTYAVWGTGHPSYPPTNSLYASMLMPGTFWYSSYAYTGYTYVICQYRMCKSYLNFQLLINIFCDFKFR